MHLVLVAIHLEPSPRAVPLGPAMLASALRRAFGTDLVTTVLDLFLQDDPGACAERILALAPDYVGFSMYLWNRGLALAIGRELKRRRPELVLFAGGSEATADLAGVLADPAMDFVLPGEGEELIVEAFTLLRQGLPVSALQRSIHPGPVQDLASLVSPFLDGTLDPRQYSGQLWELSRGCPFTCDFCFESRGGSGTRRVPMERIQAELEAFEAAQVSQVFVLDPTFNFNRKQAKEVLRLIQDRAPAIHFFFEVRSEFLDRELAGLFASVKCTLQIGLQSCRPEVLKQIGRTLDPADFQAKILLLHQAGATYGFDLIYGLPGDTLEGFLESLDFALSLAPNHLDVFRLSVLPGTRLRETAPGFQLQHQPEHPYQVLGSPTFSGEDLARAERIARGCDQFYNQGKAVPWFGIIQGGQERPPSELFQAFAEHQERCPELALTAQVRGFVAGLYPDQRAEMATVAEDLVTYFSACADLADAVNRAALPRPEPGPLRLAPHTRLLALHHDPACLLEQLAEGITELEDLSFMVPAQPGSAILHCHAGETALRPLDPDQAEALARLSPGQPLEPCLQPLVAAGILVGDC